jgi:hypothetical protein
MHRALRGFITELQDRPQGRPPKPEREAELEKELEALKKENAKLKSRVDTVDRLLGVASDLVAGKLKLSGRSRQTGAEPAAEDSSGESDEPDGEAREKLQGVRALRALGLALPLAVALVASSASTVRRLARRERDGLPLVQRRGPPTGAPSAELAAAGEQVVRQMRGLIGAEALSHAVPGLSRRKAAAVKQATLTQMERERIGACESISVTAPGVMRGFDAVHVGENFLLVASDASVPYRTLIEAVQSYDSRWVAAALELDIALNGAPLVYRMDRAKCHQTAEVQGVLDAHGVLLLHGPPRHPQYYGQLERQNREHRAWLESCGDLDLQQLGHEAAEMKYSWNCSLPRRSLLWKTASEAWSQRAVIDVDRRSLKQEVEDRAARIQRQLEARGEHAGMAERLAIEATLTKHGWLVRSGGVEC